MGPILGDRRLFSTLRYEIYANHAGISPPSRPVVQALTDVGEDYAARAFAAWPTYNDQRTSLRQRLARMLCVDSEDLGFTSNTTQGVIDIALSVAWKPGDRVVVFAGEFPANVTPWQSAAKTFSLELEMLSLEPFARSAQEGLDALERALSKGVRLVAVSAVQFQTGLRMPLEAMAALVHRYGGELFVDAVQACGIIPLNLRALAVDYLACGSHKWLMGTEGAGFVYVHPDKIAKLVPRVAGWLSHEEPVRFLLEGAGHLRYDRPIRARTDFIEGGNLPTPSLAALEASVKLLEDLTIDRIFAHTTQYLDALEPQLTALGFHSMRSTDRDLQSGSLCLRPPQHISLEALHRGLLREHIATAMPDGFLRISPHWPNAMREVPTLVQAVRDVMRTLESAP